MDRPGLRDEVARRAGLRGGSSRGSDGTTYFSLFLSGRNGFSALGALNDLGTINLLVNLSVAEKGGVEVDPESRTKGYPSIEGFAYRLIQGELVVQVLFKKEEQDPSELNQPMDEPLVE